MITHRAIIEFWIIKKVSDKQAKFRLRLETSAAPPPIGAIINISSEDYEVLDVDYTVDQPGAPLPHAIYRRNVYMRLSKQDDINGAG